jgi:ABC-type dipeptide/oligopeptide/nickel transport system ATPase component
MTTRNNGQIMSIIGKSRCGKSTMVKAIIAEFSRVLVSDPKNQYSQQMGYERFFDRHDLITRLQEVGAGAGKFAFVPTSPADFDFISDAAFVWNLQAPICFVAEELAMFASSGRSSGHWAILINQGLEFGITILGTVQRGQEVDKTIMNNATFIHVMQHGTDSDAMYIASKIGVDVEKIPREPMKFIQWSDAAGLICEGDSAYMGQGAKAKPIFKVDGKPVAILPSGKFKGIEY